MSLVASSNAFICLPSEFIIPTSLAGSEICHGKPAIDIIEKLCVPVDRDHWYQANHMAQNVPKVARNFVFTNVSYGAIAAIIHDLF